MTLQTFEFSGYANDVSANDNRLATPSSNIKPNITESDNQFITALLLGNAALSQPIQGRMLCDVEVGNVNRNIEVATELIRHRFSAFEVFLRSASSYVEKDFVAAISVEKSREDLTSDASGMASSYIDDLRSLARGRRFVTPTTLAIYQTLENALYKEIHAAARKLSKEERIRFNDRLATASNVDVQWSKLQSAPNALAVLYNFAPYTDTGAVVASKRIRDTGDLFDVIACSFANRKKIDTTIERIAAPYVVSKTFLPMVPSWATWNAFKGYAVRASRLAASNIASGRTYEYVYTRAMWAPSHYAGALIKKKFPTLEWVAEFSDPLSLDVEGLPRGGSLPEDEFLHDLLVDIEIEFGPVPESVRTIFAIAEIIAYAQADRIIFTNHHQQTTMLEQIYSKKLKERVAKVSEVSNHPTLPSEFYDTEDVEYETDNEVVNLAYFGEFYATRGLTEVTMAIRMLPESIRDKVHLHVFTNYIPVSSSGSRPRGMSGKAYQDLVNRAIHGVGAYGIEPQVHLNGSLPYLTFLAITRKFDYLLVNDARSGAHHAVNPYLPSKWSDYAGSASSSWAFVEDGSSLSGKPATVKTPLGDVESIAEELKRIVYRKLGIQA